LLHDADNIGGHLQVLTIPENFADLYHYPEAVLNAIRRIITKHLPVRLEAPAKVSLFVYDNGTFIVENFRDEAVKAGVSLGLQVNQLWDIASHENIATTQRKESPGWGKPEVPVAKIAAFTVPPHSFRAFRID
jgi:hypothetical protein